MSPQETLKMCHLYKLCDVIECRWIDVTDGHYKYNWRHDFILAGQMK